jgi:Transposase, Mutator family
MTNEMMSLQALLEKSSDADLLREMIGFAAYRLMELEVETLTGAAHGERSADRINHRNGYRERAMGRVARAWHHPRCEQTRRGFPMPQVNDLSRCLAAVDQDSELSLNLGDSLQDQAAACG